MNRYATLFAFTEEEDIDIPKLEKQWSADLRGVVGMISAAKGSKTLYADLRRLGFEDTEFPEWWYSPARVDVESGRVDVEQTRLTPSDDVLTEPKTSDVEVLTPAMPRNPVPMEVGGGRPVIQVDSTQVDSTRLETAEVDQVDFTSAELDLLGSKGVVRAPSGAWFHREEYPDGRVMTTPVNPHAELRRLREEGQSSFILDNVNKNMVEQLQGSTQSRAPPHSLVQL